MMWMGTLAENHRFQVNDEYMNGCASSRRRRERAHVAMIGLLRDLDGGISLEVHKLELTLEYNLTKP